MQIPKPPPGYRPPQPDTGPEQQATEPRELFKAYADAPDGITKNKPLIYRTQNLDHSINVLIRLIKAGWKIRAAYHQYEDKRSDRIDVKAKQAGLV